jgi:hypothetical protein
MNDEDKQRLITELKAIAASIRDPTQRDEVLEILARLHDEMLHGKAAWTATRVFTGSP